MIVRPVCSSHSQVLLDERVAPEVVPRQAFPRQSLLDDVLRRDARMVVAGLPERVEAAHPVPAHENVLDRPVQRMAHVQLARDIRGRHADDVRRVLAPARASGVEALGLPCLLPARFDAGGCVQGVHGARV